MPVEVSNPVTIPPAFRYSLKFLVLEHVRRLHCFILISSASASRGRRAYMLPPLNQDYSVEIHTEGERKLWKYFCNPHMWEIIPGIGYDVNSIAQVSIF